MGTPVTFHINDFVVPPVGVVYLVSVVQNEMPATGIDSLEIQASCCASRCPYLLADLLPQRGVTEVVGAYFLVYF